MKAKPTEKKLTIWSGSFLLVKLGVLLMIPLAVPAFGWLAEALVWRHLLAYINGINLMGGLLEAFALSAALGVFAGCANLLLAFLAEALNKSKRISVLKLAQKKPMEIKSWVDIYRNLPGLRALSQHLLINSLGLALFSALQPLRLHFSGLPELLLAAGVLSACWVFCMSLFSIVVCTYLLKKSRTAAAEAAKVAKFSAGD